MADNRNGTALISGTATATGSTTVTITAANGITPNATQQFTIVVGQAPSFTSADAAAAAIGSPFSFTVTTTGYPGPSFGWDNVPPGLTFTDNGNGTATLAGTPTTAGTYAMALSAANSFGTGQQTLTVTVSAAPGITSGNAATFTVGTGETFIVTTTGTPTAAITETGALPTGVTFTDNANGTATLTGTAVTGSQGSYPFTITAANGISPSASQSFTLTVNAVPTPPAITSGNTTSFTVGTAGDFSVVSTGNPAATITESGALPAGLTFTGPPGGMATLAGTPGTGSQGSYPITITASNGVSPDASQSFTLTVNPATAAPVITSAGSTTFPVGTAGSFSVTTTGLPTAAISAAASPALPSGVTFKDNGNGTATLSGTPPAGSQGTYTVTITAANSTGTATQSFVLTVNASSSPPTTNPNPPVAPPATPPAPGPGPVTAPTGTAPTGTAPTSTAPAGTVSATANAPAFTSASSVTAMVGNKLTFRVSASGYPTPNLTDPTLPSGLKWTDNGNGTATIWGIPAASAAPRTRLLLSAANVAGHAEQVLTITVQRHAGISSSNPPAATTGRHYAFTVTAYGYPAPTITESGNLPAGLTFSRNGNDATLRGVPLAGSGGAYRINVTVSNYLGKTVTHYTLTTREAPKIASPVAARAVHNRAFVFIVRTAGYPRPTFTHTATPPGLKWTNNGNGTATISGRPTYAAVGVHRVTISAKNAYGKTSVVLMITVS